MALRQLTEAEALAAALCNAHPESHFADKLTERPGEFWLAFGHDVRQDTPLHTAICVYFAVRGGAVVMREETAEEIDEREDVRWVVR